MRIIGGLAGGRRLKAPEGGQTRPTSDRVREALFSILGAPPDSAAVLDLFAGSGGLGLEALSRGVASALFVDQNNAALKAVRHNIAALELDDKARVVRAEAIRTLQRLAKERRHFHWIFIDPPYQTELAALALREVGSGDLLCDSGTLVVEHDRRRVPAETEGCLVKTDSRHYGDTCVSFYRRPSP